MKRCMMLTTLVLQMIVLAACGDEGGSRSLTVATNIQTSSADEPLATIDPPNEIILTFSEPLASGTVQGNVSLQTVKTGGVTEITDPELELVASPQQPSQLLIRTRNGSLLPSGEEYRLTVSGKVRALSGAGLTQEYVRFFATDYGFKPPSQPQLPAARTKSIIISDIHLGDQRSIDNKYGWTVKNRDRLVSFLKFMRQQQDLKELIIAGDLFDEWVAPMGYDTFNGMTQSQFLDSIAAANQDLVAALNAIIQDGLIRVTYLPGNHDMLVDAADINRIFPGIRQSRDAQGLGAYTPPELQQLVVEHGHRYDFFNAPDPISNREITKSASILPPGFFVTKIAASSDLERGVTSYYLGGLNTGQPGSYFTYWAVWQLIMKGKPITESWDDRIIKTNADGYTATYAVNDLIPRYDAAADDPLDVVLYKDIMTTWGQRQTSNRVAVPIVPVELALAGVANLGLELQSEAQYFLNKGSNKRIVVFGHTHAATVVYQLNHKLQWSLYANSGTWVDHGKPSCTFVMITPKKDNGATTDTVTAYQYVDDNNIPKIKSGAIKD